MEVQVLALHFIGNNGGGTVGVGAVGVPMVTALMEAK
jgi:hypothetical protein